MTRIPNFLHTPSLRHVTLGLGLALATTVSAQLPLKKGDAVCLIGNALADRMQHDGWVETHIQSRMAGQNLTFRNLALYTEAIKQVATEKGVAFVDLFNPSKELYAKAKPPLTLTLNGVHLLPEGNRQIGEVIAAAVTGKPAPSSPALEPLRQAVLDKNWHWHNRFRATDENDMWGTRAGRSYVNKQTNAEVLLMNDTLLILPDENRDGVADKAIEFAKVHNPLGFAFWGGGVIVVSQITQ